MRVDGSTISGARETTSHWWMSPLCATKRGYFLDIKIYDMVQARVLEIGIVNTLISYIGGRNE